MKQTRKDWTPQEEYALAVSYYRNADTKDKWVVISREVGRTKDACVMHWRLHGTRLLSRLEVSPYPKYDSPLQMVGDALILPDLELPFHDADFINRCLDVAQAWGIGQCILAGDMLHFESLSSWEAPWTKDNDGGLDEDKQAMLADFMNRLPEQYQQEGADLLEEIGDKTVDGDADLSTELKVSRKAVRSLQQVFPKVDVICGNHEGRLLRQLGTPLFPEEIGKLVEAGEWRFAPYYYMTLESNGVKYQIEHPKSSAVMTAERLASKYLVNVIMGHSHLLRFSWDVSGRYYAITSGCCVDEERLPYAAQRHTNQPAHALGATIVREGYPYLLYSGVNWKRLEAM